MAAVHCERVPRLSLRTSSAATVPVSVRLNPAVSAGFCFAAQFYFIVERVVASEALCGKQIPLGCCRACVFPGKSGQLLTGGEEARGREDLTACHLHI